jgi:VIT1/CCC1 family predicted Fe2+/Mn2+ transporter
LVKKFLVEKQFTATDTGCDIVIIMSNGLTVPFTLAADLSGVVSSISVVIIAGLAEIAVGSIAMGLGGYLAARTVLENYMSEKQRENQEIEFLLQPSLLPTL